MRRLVWLIVILAVMWCAWWVVASTVMQTAIATWFEERRAVGWQAEVGDISELGFPLSLHAQLQGVSIADPTSRVAIEVPQFDLMAAAYWPGFMTVKLPGEPIFISSPIGRIKAQTQGGQADLRLRPGSLLQLQSMIATSGPWQASIPEGNLLSADDLHIAVEQDDTVRETYHFVTNATKLTPGSLPRAILALPADWPASFDVFTADLSVTFDAPWDRVSMTAQRPQPRAISLREINAVWGNLGMTATGEVTIDAFGIPTGAISLTITDWRDFVQLAEVSGVLQSTKRPQLEIMLSALSNLAGSPDDLDLNLSFADGSMALGPINLGPAPRLVLR